MKRKRLFPILLLLLSSFVSSNAWGFSLGNIRVKTSFNKRFSAVVPVKLDGPMALTAELGNMADYERLDLYRNPLLDKILVTVRRESASGAILNLESPEPLFLSSFNLLVKCVHNGGTIYENFLVAADFRRQLSLNVPEQKLTKKEESPYQGGAVSKEEEKTVPEQVRKAQDVMRTPIAREFEREEREAKKREENRSKLNEVKKKPPLKKTVPSEEKTKREYYRVAKGDTLYKIAKKIGAAPKRVESFVVEIWRKNLDKFFKQNMNFLEKDVKLDITGVSENSISRREALSVIRSQWKELAKKDFFPGGGASISGVSMVEIPLPYEKDFWDAGKVSETVREWKKRWESTDIDSFMEMYSKRFRRGVYHYKSWRSFKRAFNARHRRFRIAIGHIKIRIEREMAVASFTQEFTSPRMHTRGTKTLSFFKEGGEYKIGREVWIREIQQEGKRPYVIHVSSFRTHELAVKEVNWLRKKGYSAYEILSEVGDRGTYYRVVIDRFATEAEAVSFSRRITRKKVVDYGNPLKMPFAVEIGNFTDTAAALAKILELRKFFFSPCLLVKCEMNQCYYQILIGAYKNKKNALPVSGKLAEAGFENSIIRP